MSRKRLHIFIWICKKRENFFSSTQLFLVFLRFSSCSLYYSVSIPSSSSSSLSWFLLAFYPFVIYFSSLICFPCTFPPKKTGAYFITACYVHFLIIIPFIYTLHNIHKMSISRFQCNSSNDPIVDLIH